MCAGRYKTITESYRERERGKGCLVEEDTRREMEGGRRRRGRERKKGGGKERNIRKLEKGEGERGKE